MKIGIVGATGEVGQMMIKNLEEFSVPATELRLFASARSAGKEVLFNKKSLTIEELTEDKMREKYDYLLFSAGSAISKVFAPIAAEAGNIVIDNSSAFRRDKNIPLIVPEINGGQLKGYRGIIANPNCSTIQIALALNVIKQHFDIKRVIITTMQSVSGAGHHGIAILEEQRKGSTDIGIFPQHIDLNVIPQIGAFEDDGYCEEEHKLQFEMQRILSAPDLEISSTVTRVPVMRGHSASVFVQLQKEIEIEKLHEAFKNSPAIQYNEDYMTPYYLNNSNDSHVSRLRYAFDKSSIQFWNVADNVRLGAATNAVKIMLNMR